MAKAVFDPTNIYRERSASECAFEDQGFTRLHFGLVSCHCKSVDGEVPTETLMVKFVTWCQLVLTVDQRLSNRVQIIAGTHRNGHVLVQWVFGERIVNLFQCQILIDLGDLGDGFEGLFTKPL